VSTGLCGDGSETRSAERSSATPLGPISSWRKPSRALLGLDGSETRPYMGIGTFTPFFDANFFASG
jgi:hypothetical protein